MVMKLTEAQLKKYIDYIRREVRALENLAENEGGPVGAAIRSRATAIYQQIARLEKEI